MAGIDYNILGQIKPFQLESPMNAMTQALQLRGLQDTLQLNALKAQEYQQQQQEKNALARLMGSGIPYGSDEFFNRLSVEAPSYVEPIASGLEKRRKSESERETALLTRQQREAAEEEQRRKTRLANREFGLRKIAGAPDYGQAVSMIERSVRAGEIDREEADDMLSRLNPDADMGQFRTQTLTNMLAPEKALTAGADIEKATLGVNKEKRELETKELDQALTGFNKAYNPAFISTTDKNVGRAQVTQRLKAMYAHNKLGVEAAKFMPLEEALKQHLDAYNNDPYNYVAAVMDLSGDKIIEARNKKADEEYAAYQAAEIFEGRVPLDQTAYFARKQAPQVTSAPAPTDAAQTAPVPADATPPAVKVGEPVVKSDKRDGLDYLHPEAKRLFALSATAKTPAQRQALEAAANKIQAAFEEDIKVQRKRTELPQDAQDVENMRAKVRALRKESPTLENLTQINDLLELIKTAKQGKGTNVQVGVKLSEQEKGFEGDLGKGQAKKVLENKDKAEDARDMLDTARIGREILKSGTITGAGADFFVGLNQALKTAGVDFGYAEASANSQAYAANMAQNVGKLIKLFGAGTGLSDADRKYAERMAGGQISLDKTALEKILDIQERASRNVIQRHNKSVKGIKTNIPLEVELDEAPSAPAAAASIPKTNSKGWVLKKDNAGNRAYVSPDGKQYEEVK